MIDYYLILTEMYKEKSMDFSLLLLGGLFLLFSHCCAYKFGKYQGWLDAFRQDTPYGKEGMHLRDGETFLGVGGCATRSVFLHR